MNTILLNALHELNSELVKKQIKTQLIICGAFAIEMHGLNRSHETIDIDTYLRLNSDIKDLIYNIGLRKKIKTDWLNDQVSDVIPPEGYECRLLRITKWSNIHVQLMSVEDLIKMKVAAWYTRGQTTTKDYEDLITMSATNEQILLGVEHTKKALGYGELPLKFKREFDVTMRELLEFYGK